MRLLRLISRLRVFLLIVLEAALAGASFLAAIYILNPDPSFYLEYENGPVQIAGVAFTYLVVGYLLDSSRQVRVRSRLVLILQLFQLIGVILVIQAAIAFISRELVIPQLESLLGSVITFVVVLLWRVFLRPALWKALGQQRALFVGGGNALDSVVQAYESDPMLGVVVVGSVAETETSSPRLRCLGPLSDFGHIVEETRPDRIIIGDDVHDADVLKILFEYKASGLPVETAARVYEQTFGRVYLFTLKPYTIIHRDELSPRPGSLALQAIYTNVLGLVTVVLSLPLLVVLAIALRVARKGLVFETVRCVGLHGIPFNAYRFHCPASAHDAASRFVNRFKLGGLPGVFNIIRGEIGLIGPRADTIHAHAVLTDLVPVYRHRQYVRPGFFGWSQLHCDSRPTEDTLASLEYDLFYIKHISLMMDAYILLRALKWVISGNDTEVRAISVRAPLPS